MRRRTDDPAQQQAQLESAQVCAETPLCSQATGKSRTRDRRRCCSVTLLSVSKQSRSRPPPDRIHLGRSVLKETNDQRSRWSATWRWAWEDSEPIRRPARSTTRSPDTGKWLATAGCLAGRGG